MKLNYQALNEELMERNKEFHKKQEENKTRLHRVEVMHSTLLTDHKDLVDKGIKALYYLASSLCLASQECEREVCFVVSGNSRMHWSVGFHMFSFLFHSSHSHFR